MTDGPRARRLALDRAPRLRLLAALVDHQAGRCSSPAQARARRKLAQSMRVRASEIDAGDRDSSDDELLRRARELGFGG